MENEKESIKDWDELTLDGLVIRKLGPIPEVSLDDAGDHHVIPVMVPGDSVEMDGETAFKRFCEFLDIDPEWAKANMWSPYDTADTKPK